MSYKFEYWDSTPEEGFYWLFLGDGTCLGIAHTNDIYNSDLKNEYPGMQFCGPIPLPREKEMRKIGRGTVKARADRPVKKI